MEQETLWHDRLEDAVRAAVDALGGPKKAGAMLWPTLKIEDAARKLLHALDPDRAEKLAFAELDMIGREAAKANCHTIPAYLADAWGYERPRRVEPEDEMAVLQREFIASVRQQEELAKRLDHLMSLRLVEGAA